MLVVFKLSPFVSICLLVNNCLQNISSETTCPNSIKLRDWHRDWPAITTTKWLTFCFALKNISLLYNHLWNYWAKSNKTSWEACSRVTPTQVQKLQLINNNNNKIDDFLLCSSETTRPNTMKLHRKCHCMTLTKIQQGIEIDHHQQQQNGRLVDLL